MALERQESSAALRGWMVKSPGERGCKSADVIPAKIAAAIRFPLVPMILGRLLSPEILIVGMH